MYIQDFVSLLNKYSQLYPEFEKENFVAQVSGRQFSRIHYDQAHKNGAKQLSLSKFQSISCKRWVTERKWKIAGPKIAKYLE